MVQALFWTEDLEKVDRGNSKTNREYQLSIEGEKGK